MTGRISDAGCAPGFSSDEAGRLTTKANATRIARREFLRLAGVAAALPASSWVATAQTYPTQPVRIVVGFTPGGAFDIVARLMGQWLSEQLRQPFMVENRPGAGTNIATEAVIRGPADGYTLLLCGAANAVNASLYETLNFNFIADVAPVAGIIRFPNVMEVNPSFPARTVPEFIAYAKANPGKINMGSAGKGTTQHLSGELFKMMTGVDLVHVPYRGAPQALADLQDPRKLSLGYRRSSPRFCYHLPASQKAICLRPTTARSCNCPRAARDRRPPAPLESRCSGPVRPSADCAMRALYRSRVSLLRRSRSA